MSVNSRFFALLKTSTTYGVVLLFALVLVLENFQYAAIIAKASIPEYANAVGEYYDKDLLQPSVIDQEVEEGSRSIMRHTIFSNNALNFEEEEAEVEVERPDEFTIIKDSEEEEGLKIAEIYQYAVNYISEDGSFQPIDTRIKSRSENVVEEAMSIQTNEGLSFSSEGGIKEELLEVFDELSFEARYPFYNDTHSAQFNFPIDLNDGLLIIKDAVTMTIQPELEEGLVPEILGSEIYYPSAQLSGIRYAMTMMGLKEELILLNPTEQSEFVSHVSIENGYLVNGEGNVVVLSDEGELIFLITAPKAFDAAGNETENVAVRYEEDKLIVSVDPEWLQSEERVYPITIDPTYTFGAHQHYDVSVSQKYPTKTISSPNLELTNWVLTDPADAYLYLGTNTNKFGLTYSYYRMTDDAIAFLRGKYLKKATARYLLTTSSQANNVITCPVTQTLTKEQIKTMTWNSKPTSYGDCKVAASIPAGGAKSEVNLDFTEYLRWIVNRKSDKIKRNAGEIG